MGKKNIPDLIKQQKTGNFFLALFILASQSSLLWDIEIEGEQVAIPGVEQPH